MHYTFAPHDMLLFLSRELLIFEVATSTVVVWGVKVVMRRSFHVLVFNF